jgi:hypothetical protein
MSPRSSSPQNRRKRTLIIVSRTLTEPKTALAGVTLETSFARFKASMATFNAERRPPHPFGRWESVAIAETCAGAGEWFGKEAVRKKPNADADGRSFHHKVPCVQLGCPWGHFESIFEGSRDLSTKQMSLYVVQR